MANILRYSPADDTFDDLFRGFFMRPVTFEGPQVNQLKIDVSEDEKAYTVHAEIPGVKKDDIDVRVDGNTVTISAEVKSEKEESVLLNIVWNMIFPVTVWKCQKNRLFRSMNPTDPEN